jgi:hypothetical protein
MRAASQALTGHSREGGGETDLNCKMAPTLAGRLSVRPGTGAIAPERL